MQKQAVGQFQRNFNRDSWLIKKITSSVNLSNQEARLGLELLVQ